MPPLQTEPQVLELIQSVLSTSDMFRFSLFSKESFHNAFQALFSETHVTIGAKLVPFGTHTYCPSSATFLTKWKESAKSSVLF